MDYSIETKANMTQVLEAIGKVGWIIKKCVDEIKDNLIRDLDFDLSANFDGANCRVHISYDGNSGICNIVVNNYEKAYQDLVAVLGAKK